MVDRRPALHVLAPALVGAAVLVAMGQLLFGSAGRDDSYITYWVAQSLSEHGAIVNYNGDPIEQSSSLLHVWLLAAAHRVTGMALATLGPVVSLLGGALTVVSVAAMARAVSIRMAWAAGLVCALHPFLVYWSSSGLETSLTALITLHVAHWGGRVLQGPSRRSIVMLAVSAVALVLVRPEGAAILVTWAGMLGLAPLVRHRRIDRALAGLFAGTGIGLAAFGIVTAWRLARTGMAFPLPVTAKFGGDLRWVAEGLGYLQEHLLGVSFVVLVVVIIMGHLARRRRGDGEAWPLPVGSYLAAVGAQLLFAITSGGDWMEAGRFLVPVMAILVLASVQVGWARWDARRPRAALVGVLALALFVDALVLTARHSTGFAFLGGRSHIDAVFDAAGVDPGRHSYFERHNRMHLREIPTIAQLDRVIDDVGTMLGRPVVVMTMQMGMVADYAGRAHRGQIRWVDRVGLTTPEVSACRHLDQLPRTPHGIELTYPHFFGHFDAIHHDCRIPLPDVIYDVSGIRSVARNGYQIVYRQDGPIAGDGRWGGAEIRSHQYIGIRRDLLERLPDWRATRRLRWPASP